jgi:hypothetical protein
MDEIITDAPIDAIEDTSSFLTEIAKSFVISAATTAGFMTGLMAVGYAKKKLDARKKAKETASPTEPETAK